MANKKLLHDKMLKQDNILDINLLPSAPIQAMFRPNTPAANLSPDQQQAFPTLPLSIRKEKAPTL